ncbi:PREDICTED: trichohyalin-like [Elephantulus edwardii]|uniref:trichohyalin-like n=1 Tax=Elephantulus edwardii TaxID=28737 RepID=UPI0003F0C5E1|nr:PREDICTED: trichohyalin-like [Elephantulus edwardii]
MPKEYVKVCRDFAVLEDHTLAHSLQEQEIEHHLASNVQRNRLVQHDLKVAKQLQEEDLKAQAQLQKRYKDLEQQDCEIAQEIQEKLTIEAERRRIQEKKDEDIARILQEKELEEEKRRKKHFSESSGISTYGESYYYEDGDQPRSRRARELGSEFSRPSRLRNDGKPVKQREEKPKLPLDNLEDLQEHCLPEQPLAPSHWDKMRDDPQMNSEKHKRKQCGHKRLQRPPLPRISGDVLLTTESDDWEANNSQRTQKFEKRYRYQDQLSPEFSQKVELHNKEILLGRDQGLGEHRKRRHRPRTPPFSESKERLHLRDTGMKARGMKEAVSTPSRATHRDQEWYDAEIARKLQEEELLATQEDLRAAQVAQDEEIARLLMAEEKKAYKKAKEREKSSLDKRKHDTDWKPKTAKSAHPKSKESDEAHRSKNDRPARPPPPAMAEDDDLDYSHFTNQHNSTRHFSKSESSHKGYQSFLLMEKTVYLFTWSDEWARTVNLSIGIPSLNLSLPEFLDSLGIHMYCIQLTLTKNVINSQRDVLWGHGLQVSQLQTHGSSLISVVYIITSCDANIKEKWLSGVARWIPGDAAKLKMLLWTHAGVSPPLPPAGSALRSGRRGGKPFPWEEGGKLAPGQPGCRAANAELPSSCTDAISEHKGHSEVAQFYTGLAQMESLAPREGKRFVHISNQESGTAA